MKILRVDFNYSIFLSRKKTISYKSSLKGFTFHYKITYEYFYHKFTFQYSFHCKKKSRNFNDSLSDF